MGTLNTIGSLGSSLGGYSSITTSGKNENFDTFGTVGVLLTATATSMSLDAVVNADAKAIQVDQSKAYVQSLSIEEQHELLNLLDEKEQQLEQGKPYIKKYNSSKQN